MSVVGIPALSDCTFYKVIGALVGLNFDCRVRDAKLPCETDFESSDNG